jgi:hypothetical protein
MAPGMPHVCIGRVPGCQQLLLAVDGDDKVSLDHRRTHVFVLTAVVNSVSNHSSSEDALCLSDPLQGERQTANLSRVTGV